MFPLLWAWRRRIRERDRTRCDRNDVAVVVDGVDAVLQHLLAGTAWIPSKRELVPRACHTVARRSDQAVDCHVRAQVKRVAIHTSVGDVQLQRCQLRRQHVGHVRRGGAQQPGSELGVVVAEGMDCAVRVYQLARVEKGHHGRQQGRSGSIGIACQKLVAVLVTPEAQGQPTTRRQAVVPETARLGSARCEHDHGCSARRMVPVGLSRVCLSNHVVARSGQVAPSGASAISGKLCNHRRSTPSSGLMQNGQPVRAASPASWNPFALLSKYLQTVIEPVGGGVGLAEHVVSSPCLAQLG